MLNNKVIAIRADLPNLDNILKELDRMEQGDLPFTQKAVEESTNLIQRTWLDYISGATVTYSGGTFRVRTISGEYRRSIVDGVSYPALGDKLTGEVTSHSPHARFVEDGVQPYDMKQTHLSGSKVKISKAGHKYITVPFRHNVPGHSAIADAMPEQVYAHAKQMMYSRRNNVLKEWWTGQAYTWGDRLPASLGGEKEKPHWTTGKYTGMVRMGSPRHTQYLTFRRLSENSKPEAWQHPGTDPRPVTEAVKENVRDKVIDLIRTGFEVDLVQMGW